MKVEVKKCSRCQQHKPLSEFTKNRSHADGYSNLCLDCNAWYARRVTSLDAKRDALYGYSLYAILPAQGQAFDSTYERVFYALHYWVDDGILSDREAEALYLHAVELFSYAEAGRIVEEPRINIQRAYERGVTKLRARYADVMEQAG